MTNKEISEFLNDKIKELYATNDSEFQKNIDRNVWTALGPEFKKHGLVHLGGVDLFCIYGEGYKVTYRTNYNERVEYFLRSDLLENKWALFGFEVIEKSFGHTLFTFPMVAMHFLGSVDARDTSFETAAFVLLHEYSARGRDEKSIIDAEMLIEKWRLKHRGEPLQDASKYSGEERQQLLIRGAEKKGLQRYGSYFLPYWTLSLEPEKFDIQYISVNESRKSIETELLKSAPDLEILFATGILNPNGPSFNVYYIDLIDKNKSSILYQRSIHPTSSSTKNIGFIEWDESWGTITRIDFHSDFFSSSFPSLFLKGPRMQDESFHEIISNFITSSHNSREVYELIKANEGNPEQRMQAEEKYALDLILNRGKLNNEELLQKRSWGNNEKDVDRQDFIQLLTKEANVAAEIKAMLTYYAGSIYNGLVPQSLIENDVETFVALFSGVISECGFTDDKLKHYMNKSTPEQTPDKPSIKASLADFFSEKEQFAIIKAIWHIACSDGEVAVEERKMIVSVAQVFGMTYEEIIDATEMSIEDSIAIVSEMSDSQKTELVQLFYAMVKADGVQKEIEMMKVIAFCALADIIDDLKFE